MENQVPKREMTTLTNALGIERRVPMATDAEVAELEARMRRKCERFLPWLEKMSASSAERFWCACIFPFDFKRGLVFGQQPHLYYKHSPEFKKWENDLLELVNQKLEG
jgi:hypothetical protein